MGEENAPSPRAQGSPTSSRLIDVPHPRRRGALRWPDDAGRDVRASGVLCESPFIVATLHVSDWVRDAAHLCRRPGNSVDDELLEQKFGQYYYSQVYVLPCVAL